LGLVTQRLAISKTGPPLKKENGGENDRGGGGRSKGTQTVLGGEYRGKQGRSNLKKVSGEREREEEKIRKKEIEQLVTKSKKV